MGSPVDWRGSNRVLVAPRGHEATVQPLHVFANGHVCVSCWELSPEELAEIARTGRVFLSVHAGPSQPPVFLGSENEVRALVLDSGPVWPKEEK